MGWYIDFAVWVLETPAPCTLCLGSPKGVAFRSHHPKCCEFQTAGYPEGQRAKWLALQSIVDFFSCKLPHRTFLCPDLAIRIFQGRLGNVVFILMDRWSVKKSVTVKGGENENWGTTVHSVPAHTAALGDYLSCLVDTSGNVLWLFLWLAVFQFARDQLQILSKLCTVVEENTVGNALKKLQNNYVQCFSYLVLCNKPFQKLVV